MMRGILAIVMLGVAACSDWGLGNPREVRVGIYENPPAVFTSTNDEPAGLFIDLFRAIAAKENWRLVPVRCNWAECLDMLDTGRIDLIPDIAFTTERMNRFSFNQIVIINSWSQVLTRFGQTVLSVADLSGSRVAILKDSVQLEFFTQLMEGGLYNYDLQPVTTTEEGFAAVKQGKADAVVASGFAAARLAGRYGLQETPLVFQPNSLYFATAKGRNLDLLERVDAHMRAWRIDANSPYHEALRRNMTLPEQSALPPWIRWSLIALGPILLLLLGLSLLLRWQVAQRTRALTRTAHELEQQRAQLEVRVAERTARLRALFDSASVGIVLLKDRVVQECNHSLDNMFGYTEGELIGKPTRLWYASDEEWTTCGNEVYEQVWRGQIHRREQRVLHKDGTPFWVRMTIRAIDVAHPEEGAVEVLEDITAERAALEEIHRAKILAEDATRMKSEFLANMSHEIRTPMNAILGMLYLALKNDLTPHLRSQLTKAQGSAQALLGIINDILDFSKIEAGKLELDQIEFGLDTVLEQLTDAVGFQAEQKGLEFLIRYDMSIPGQLIGDPLRLGQVLTNLCGNAVKFTEQGEIEVALRSIGGDGASILIQVCVRDSGIGMTPDMQSRLFEKFSQADQSTTRRFGGTGLGLAISKNLVELMGGRIWVEDSQEGQGTTLCFTARFGLSGAAHRLMLAEQAGTLLQDQRALVVDDNAVSREIMADLLRNFRLDVDTAASGSDAIAKLESAHPPYTLVLMDWRMPGMNGDEATRRIIANPLIDPRPRIIMVTAHGREDVVRSAENAGVDGLMFKPVSPSALLDGIMNALGRGRILGDAATQAQAMSATHAHELAGARLLLVEDNDINREFALELLGSEGIDIDTACDGAEAVEKIQQGGYDAVLMDIQMPVLDGLAATRRIRELPDTDGKAYFARVPIIAMTALAMPRDIEKSQAAGMNDHITKPISPEHLFALLGKWVQVPPERHRQSPASAGREAPPAIPEDLQAMSAIDAKGGIARIGGKAEAYRRQLKRFRDHHGEADVELQRLIAVEGLDKAEAFCHALKGIVGNLGATALFENLCAIDATLKSGFVPPTRMLDELHRLLRETLQDIDALGSTQAATPDAASTPLTDAQIAASLEQLIHLLDYDLGAVDPLLQQIRGGVIDVHRAEAIDKIARLIDTFETDAAKSAAIALLDRLNPEERTHDRNR